jgi:hypothetical protein
MVQSRIECADLVGKTIQSVRIFRNPEGEAEVHIELTDGTSFSCCLSQSPTVTASIYKGGSGSPEVLKSYEL